MTRRRSHFLLAGSSLFATLVSTSAFGILPSLPVNAVEFIAGQTGMGQTAMHRRSFLEKACSAAALLTGFVPVPSWADEEIEEAETSEPATVSPLPEEADAPEPVSVSTDWAELESTVQQEEKELVEELKADKNDLEVTEREDTEALIAQLEQEEDEAVLSASNEEQNSRVAAVQEKTQQLVERLEQDEEKTEAEIMRLIDKAEKLESDAERLEAKLPSPTDSNMEKQPASSDNVISPAETKEFIAVLKERSEENKDLIETLKARSQRYYDAETGRFESMSKQEFLKRKDEVMNKENVAGQLFERIKEGIVAAEEGLEADERALVARAEEKFPGFQDAVKKLSIRAKEEFLTDKAAVERLIEDEGLLQLLREREKATEEFLSKYSKYLDVLDGSTILNSVRRSD